MLCGRCKLLTIESHCALTGSALRRGSGGVSREELVDNDSSCDAYLAEVGHQEYLSKCSGMK